MMKTEHAECLLNDIPQVVEEIVKEHGNKLIQISNIFRTRRIEDSTEPRENNIGYWNIQYVYQMEE